MLLKPTALSCLLCVLAIATAVVSLPVGHHASFTNDDAPRRTPYNETTFRKMMQLHPPAQKEPGCPPPLPKFNCQPPATKLEEATRVDRLRPSDISAIMAVGDSISAGFGMISKSIEEEEDEVLLEYRGKVFSTGGDPGETTLANFLRVYNPNIVGDCTGTTSVLSKSKELNFAVSASFAKDIPDQINRLAERLATEQYLPVANKWKLLTIFIGANNICAICGGDTEDSANMFEAYLRQSVELIRAKIPKTYVAIVNLFNVSRVHEAAQTTAYCREVFGVLEFCPCSEQGPQARQQMDDGVAEYNRRIEKIAKEAQDLKDPNFTVSLLPGISEQNVAQYGQCYFSDFDCFHPNLEADRAFAINFWNNLFEPHDQKTTSFNPYSAQVYCPSEDDYFF